MSKNNKEISENYQGDGRFSSSVKSLLTTSVITGAALNMWTHANRDKLIDYQLTRNTQSMSKANAILGGTLAVVAVAAPIISAVQGWRKADRAINDHEALVRENDMLKTQNTEYSAKLDSVTEAITKVADVSSKGRVADIPKEAQLG